MVSRDDAELLRCWQAGDEGAGSELLARHVVRVSRFFRSKVADAAEDLIQQTFLGCVEGTQRMRPDSTFSAYLFGVARNVLRTYLRSRRRDRERLDLGSESIVDLCPGANSNLARRRDQRLVLEALRRIPLDMQITLEMFYWEGLNAAEIGEVLDVPHATARSRLRRAREVFEAKLNAARREAPPDTTAHGLTDWADAIRRVAADDRE